MHTAIAFGEDDFRLGEQYGLNVVNPVRLDGTYDERIGPYAGRWVKDADPDLIEDLRAARAAAARRGLRALLPALLALRHAAALLRQAVVVHRHEPDQGPPAGLERDRQLASRARQARALRQVARGQRRLGPVARALLGHAAAGVALRERAHPRDRLVPRAARAFRDAADRPPPAVRRRGHVPVPRVRRADEPSARGDRRVVRLGLDAVRPVPRPAREPGALRGSASPPNFICEALDQTRGWFYSLLAVATLLFDTLELPQRRLPRSDPRRGRPQDVEVAGQRGRALGRDRHLRRRRVPLVLLHLEVPVGRLPLQPRDDRRGGPPVPAAAVEHVRLLRPVRERERDRARCRRRRRRRPISTAGRSAA